MEMDELYTLVKSQYSLLQNFYDVLNEQQKAIIDNDFDSLENSVTNESEVIKELSNFNKQITERIQRLSVEFNLPSKAQDLSSFLELIKLNHKMDLSEINLLRNSSKDLVERIIEINEQNKILIQEGRSFIKSMISILMSGKKNHLLDRKI